MKRSTAVQSAAAAGQWLQAQGRQGCLGQLAHPLGVEVLLDVEAVHDARGGQAALDAGQQHQQQGHFSRFHSETEKQLCNYSVLSHFCLPRHAHKWPGTSTPLTHKQTPT